MMTRARLAAVCALVVALFAGAWASAQSKVDVTDTWAFEVNTDAGAGASTVTFKQDGGTCTAKRTK